MRLTKWVAVAVLAAVTAGAQVIQEVAVRQLEGYSADTSDVLTMCGSKKGADLSQAVLFDDVRRLNDSQRFSYAGVEIAEVDNGVKVIYVVRRRFRLAAPVDVQGMSAVSRSKVRDWIGLKEGSYIDEQLLGVRCSKVRDEYMKRQYPNVQVTGQIGSVDAATGATTVTVTIIEGDKIVLAGFRFTGNTAFTASELKGIFKQYNWWDPRNWFSDRMYDEQQFDDAREGMLASYRERGYLDVTIAPVKLEPLPNNPKKVRAVYEITEGVCYTLGTFSINGVTLFPIKEVQDVAAITGGENAGAPVVAAIKRVREYFTSRGYIDTFVRTTIDTPPGTPGVANVQLQITEGELVTLRNIIINGNTRTQDKVIRREILVTPGDDADAVRIERSMNRLRNLNYFSEVRDSLVATETNTVRDLVVNVTEQRTGNFMIGAGFSTIDSVMGFVEVSQNNFDIQNWPSFTGGGQKARLGAEIGSNRQTIEANWIQPWLYGREMALQVDAYRRMNSYDEYDDLRSGMAAGISYPVKVGKIGFKQTFEQVSLDDVIFMNGGTYKYADGRTFTYVGSESGLNSMFRVYWTHDTRNKPFVPTRGMEATVFGEVGGSMLGGVYDVYKTGAQVRKWYGLPWKGGHVLSLRGRMETVDAYGQDEVPLNERLYLGGGRTVRGFGHRSVGPKVAAVGSATWHSVGGQTLSFVSGEYTIPIFKALRFATFVDAGSLDAGAFSPDFSDYAASIGFGLRVDIPGFPIRVDYAKPLVKPDNTEEQAFVFWIGFE
jgi:outer membrane protein insertion porin family